MKKILLMILPLCALLVASCEKVDEPPVFTKATVETKTDISNSATTETPAAESDTLARAAKE